jgi:hypothetical protein
MKNAFQNLIYVEKALRNGTYKAEKPMLTVLLEEALEEIKNTSWQFEIPCTCTGHKEHLKTYENTALKYKSKLLADLRELQHLLNKKDVPEKKCLQMVRKLIETNLYMNYVKEMIDKFQPKSPVIENEIIAV